MGPNLAAYPHRAIFAWITFLAVLWLALSSPWSAGWNLLCGTLALCAALAAGMVATRHMRARRATAQQALRAIDAALESLPADVKRNTPLVLAIGDGSQESDAAHGQGPLQDAFGADPVRITDTAIWVRAAQPAQLMHLADALKRWRDGQGPDAVVYLLAADQIDNQASLGAALKRWRAALGEAGRALGYSLPVCVALYAQQIDAAPDECPWFGVSGDEPLPLAALPALVAARLARHTRLAPPSIREPRARQSARLDALTRWACEAVLPALSDLQRAGHPARITAFGVTARPGRPASASLYTQFIARATSLNPAATASPQLPVRPGCTLPETLLRGLARQPARRVLPRALAHAWVWLAACWCAAAAASAWQNRALVERVTGDMARYAALAPAQDAARNDALQALKSDRDELQRHASSGVPPRLGFGFYQGKPLLPKVNAMIASYEPPAPPVPPSTIELNSLALFQTGSAVLNPGSNRVLIEALEMIKAHPHKRVLVAGHTDSIGRPQANLQLSTARAKSVRDWLADAAGMPPTRFAIQGYGDTRPKSPNDTAAGRAANRRVEITLVPDCRDTPINQDGHLSLDNLGERLPPLGQQACS